MHSIHLKNTDPYFCLAAEEYLMKNFEDDIFMLWQSENAVVVGKHQNAAAEINHRFIHENNIAVCRRISGGGTVFHDSGNINFTFIKNVKSQAEISFRVFTAPVVKALAKLGIEATTSGRNDLLIDGLKISGNAEHVYKNRVLHHGTLLFDSDLKNLGQAIKVVPGKYEGKAVQSNRSPVANISQFLKTPMTTGEFIQFLLNVQLENAENHSFELAETDLQNIENLATEKFRTWEWNFGYSPKYTFRNELEIDGKKLSVRLAIEKGIIEEAEVFGGNFCKNECLQVQIILTGERHSYDVLLSFKEINGIVSAFF
ncbi:MAG TPA: lipoate--protein ligase [Prolixibacteraceae bacterium]|nr:lipoate--protein ligase [Prolixibacteraceae bacterium]